VIFAVAFLCGLCVKIKFYFMQSSQSIFAKRTQRERKENKSRRGEFYVFNKKLQPNCGRQVSG